uniref:Thioredoxin 2 n=1 Tax=Catharus ustulatus TaxID=91951 RepID=A0A8C3U9L8_CATUS
MCLELSPVNGEEAGSSWRRRGCGAGAAEEGTGAGSTPMSYPISLSREQLLAWGCPAEGLGSGRCCSGTSHGVHPSHQPLSPQMAQRLALQRLLSLPTRGPLVSHGRAFGTSAGRRNTFNVQDGGDFQDRVVNSPKPVVVDFHAQWCGPCKILGPRLEKLVAKLEGKVLMAKVDIDDHTDLAIEYEVLRSTACCVCLCAGVSSANCAGYEERRRCG